MNTFLVMSALLLLLPGLLGSGNKLDLVATSYENANFPTGYIKLLNSNMLKVECKNCALLVVRRNVLVYPLEVEDGVVHFKNLSVEFEVERGDWVLLAKGDEPLHIKIDLAVRMLKNGMRPYQNTLLKKMTYGLLGLAYIMRIVPKDSCPLFYKEFVLDADFGDDAEQKPQSDFEKPAKLKFTFLDTNFYPRDSLLTLTENNMTYAINPDDESAPSVSVKLDGEELVITGRNGGMAYASVGGELLDWLQPVLKNVGTCHKRDLPEFVIRGQATVAGGPGKELEAGTVVVVVIPRSEDPIEKSDIINYFDFTGVFVEVDQKDLREAATNCIVHTRHKEKVYLMFLLVETA